MRKLIFVLLFPIVCFGQTDNTTWTFLNSRFLLNANNLSDLGNVSTAKTNLGLGNVTNESKATMFTNSAFTGATTGASLAVTGSLTSSGTSGIGYATGAGGTVTQLTNKSTGVTINKTCGQITMSNAALAAGSEVKFTVTNSTVSATDVPVLAIKSGGTSGSYLITVSAVSAGSFDIVVSNASAGSLSEAIVISFGIIKVTSN